MLAAERDDTAAVDEQGCVVRHRVGVIPPEQHAGRAGEAAIELAALCVERAGDQVAVMRPILPHEEGRLIRASRRQQCHKAAVGQGSGSRISVLLGELQHAIDARCAWRRRNAHLSRDCECQPVGVARRRLSTHRGLHQVACGRLLHAPKAPDGRARAPSTGVSGVGIIRSAVPKTG